MERALVYEQDFRTGRVIRSGGLRDVLGIESSEAEPTLGWLMDRVHPDDHGSLSEQMARVLAEGEDYSLRYRLRHRDGHYVEVLDRGMLIRDEEGLPLRAIGTTLDVTAHRLTERRLQEREQMLNLALEAASAAAWQRRLTDDVTLWSQEYRELYGFTTEEAPSLQGWLNRVHPDDRDRAIEAARTPSSPGDRVDIEFRVNHPERGERWLNSFGRVYGGDDGPKLVGITLDVTERRLVREALAESESRFRRLAETNALGLVLSDRDGIIRYVNPAFTRNFGYTMDHIAEGGLHWSAITPPEFAEADEVAEQELIHTGNCTPYEKEYLTRDGERIPILMTASVIEGGDGIEVAAYVMDLRPIRAAEAALRASEAKFRDLADAMPQMVCTADSGGEVDYFNRTFIDYTGVSMEELRGRSWIRLVHPDDVPRLERAWQAALEESAPLETEMRVRRSDGEYRWHLVRAVPTHPEAEGTVRWYGTGTDVHEWKLLNDDLERRVQERTAELMESNREMEGFTYSVSHDLRSPLRAINSSAQMLLDDFADQLGYEGRMQLERQARAAKRLADLIDDLLRLSRIGRQSLRRERIDLSAIAREVSDELSARFDADVRFDIEPGIYAAADEQLIRLALQNLMENAAKFRDPAREVCVSFHRAEGCTFCVSDNGIGFDQRYVDKIFLPFERLVPETSYPGTGIGLANVRRIVERHGGDVRAEGRLGEGACFFVSLPKP